MSRLTAGVIALLLLRAAWASVSSRVSTALAQAVGVLWACGAVWAVEAAEAAWTVGVAVEAAG